jgi:hypothetical protein
MRAWRTAVALPATVRLRTDHLRVVATGATQTTAAYLRVFQRGGRAIARTTGAHTCTVPRPQNWIAADLTPYGRRLLRRHTTLPATVVISMRNGSGVTATVRRQVRIVR